MQPGNGGHRRHNFRVSLLLAIVSWCCLPAQPAAGQVVLRRDLTSLDRVSVESFDDWTVRLTNGRQLGWDELISGAVAPDQQVEFDRLLEERGMPVARLKQRLQFGDVLGASRLAAEVFPSFNATLPGENAISIQVNQQYIVAIMAMRHWLSDGKRERSLEAFVHAQRLESRVDEATLTLIGENSLSSEELELGWLAALVPIWFDLDQLRATESRIAQFANKQAGDFPPGLQIYLASMEIQLGKLESASSRLEQMQRDDFEKFELAIASLQWRLALEAGSDNRPLLDIRDSIDIQDDRFRESMLALHQYYAVIDLTIRDTDTKRAAVLQLLGIPALFGGTQPHLAAAALDRAIDLASTENDARLAEKLKDELLRNYPKTYHAELRMRQ